MLKIAEPKGTYIKADRNGFRYRQKRDTVEAKDNQATSATMRSTPSHQWEDTAIDVPLEEVVELIQPSKTAVLPLVIHGSCSALILGAVIVVAWYSFTYLPHNLEGRNQAGILLSTIPFAVWMCGIVVHILVAKYLYVDNRQAFYYELDQNSATRFEGVKKACEVLSQSEKVWYLGTVDNVLLETAKTPIRIGRQSPPFISTNVDVWVVDFLNWKMFFLPDNIYIFQDNKYSILSYDELWISYADRQVYESRLVPKDAKQVGRTWFHTRKDGGPDLRYKHNPAIPIVLYGIAIIESRAKWNLVLEASSVLVAQQFVEQINRSFPSSVKRQYDSRQNHQHQHRSSQQTTQNQATNSQKSKSAYEILGVKENATFEELTEAYHKQARMNHPDKVASMSPEFKALAERRMKEINAAYQELSSKFKRK